MNIQFRDEPLSSYSPIPDGRAGLARGPLLYFTLLYFGLLARPEINCWRVQKLIYGPIFFLYFVQKLTFGMPTNQFVASKLILVFRPETAFWHVQKPICGLTTNFGMSSRN